MNMLFNFASDHCKESMFRDGFSYCEMIGSMKFSEEIQTEGRENRNSNRIP